MEWHSEGAMSLGNRWMPLTRRAVRARSQLILSSRVESSRQPVQAGLHDDGLPRWERFTRKRRRADRLEAARPCGGFIGESFELIGSPLQLRGHHRGGELPRSIATYETGAHASRPDVDRFSGFRPCAFTAQPAALFVVSWSSVSADDAVSPSRGTGGDSSTRRAGRAWTAGHCRKLHERSGLPFWNLLECFQKDVSRHRDRKV